MSSTEAGPSVSPVESEVVVTGAGDVGIRWGDGSATTEDLVRAHVLAVLGPGQVDVGHLCPLCGSSAHGRPWARHAAAVTTETSPGAAVTGSTPPGALPRPATRSVHPRPASRLVRAGGPGGAQEVFVSVSRASGALPRGSGALPRRSGALPHGYAVTALSLTGPVGVDVEVVGDVARGWDPSIVLAPGERAATPAERAWHWAAKEAVLKRAGTGLATPMPQVRLADEGELLRLAAPDGVIAVLAPPA